MDGTSPDREGGRIPSYTTAGLPYGRCYFPVVRPSR